MFESSARSPTHRECNYSKFFLLGCTTVTTVVLKCRTYRVRDPTATECAARSSMVVPLIMISIPARVMQAVYR
jgi:hypothetical protein